MKVLIACEESQTVCKAFRARGHEAYSCDILPCSGGHPEWHMQWDVLSVLNKHWDMIIAFPPCTYLTVAGNRWLYHPEDKHLPTSKRRPHPKYPLRRERMEKARYFFMSIAYAVCNKIAIENPAGRMSTMWRKPDQYIQPWQFDHGETKKTGLWLKGLPLLMPTNIVEGREQRIWKMAPGPNRAQERSKTFQGIADAMAEQWGGVEG